MADDGRDLPLDRWANHLAYMGLRRIPKFTDDISDVVVTTDFDEVPRNSQPLSDDCELNDDVHGDRRAPIQGDDEGNDDESTTVNENPI